VSSCVAVDHYSNASDNFAMVAPGKKVHTISGLPAPAAKALDRHAKRLGMTIDDYLKELIVDDLELQRVARTKTFAQLAMPFQKSLAGTSDADLDSLARPARPRSRNRKRPR
jgi:hypothetical protein